MGPRGTGRLRGTEKPRGPEGKKRPRELEGKRLKGPGE
jgi:hypothetical protein